MRNPVRNAADHVRRLNFDMLAEHALEALPGPFVPWSKFAMRPGGVLTVLNDIWLNDRQVIYECGGGVSTIYIGRLLQQRGGGTLVTVEHDSLWARRMQRAVAAETLPVSVVHAPIANGPHGTWYDTAAIPPAEAVDLLVVDGPPAYTQETDQSRYPALPHFAPALAPGASIILDDIVRDGEIAVADRWEREFGVTFDRRADQGAVAVGTFAA